MSGGHYSLVKNVRVSDATIKMLGRWQSSAYQLYIRTPREQLAGVSLTLVKNM